MSNNTNNNQNEKEKKGMELWVKILLGIVGVASVGAIVFGVATYQTAKENEIKDAAVGSTIITVQDNTQSNTQSNTETEQLVDKNLQYQEEAEKLWNQHKDELVCTDNQFITEYVDYRNNGLTEKQAWNTLYNAYFKDYQAQTNEAGEVVAEPSEMDAVINSYDDNITEEVTEPVEDVVADFEVQELEPTTLYAIQNVNLRQGPSADDFAKIGSLSPRQQVTVIGIVKEYKGETVLWYLLDSGEYVSGAYLVEKLPAETPQQQQQPSQGNNNSGQQSSGQQSSGGSINIGGLQFDPSQGTTDGPNMVEPGTHEPGSLAGAPTIQ